MCQIVLSGPTAKQFLERPFENNGYGENLYSKFRTQLADSLQTSRDNVHIFTVRDVPKDEGNNDMNMVDLVYAAHGSPYYRPAKLNGRAWQQKSEVF